MNVKSNVGYFLFKLFKASLLCKLTNVNHIADLNSFNFMQVSSRILIVYVFSANHLIYDDPYNNKRLNVDTEITVFVNGKYNNAKCQACYR